MYSANIALSFELQACKAQQYNTSEANTSKFTVIGTMMVQLKTI